jgi:hypothetical protein
MSGISSSFNPGVIKRINMSIKELINFIVMATYQTTKCGSCGTAWDSMGAKDSNIGPTKIKCRSCNGINRTKMYLYRDANWFGKLYYWVTSLVYVIIFGGVSLLAGLGGLLGKFEEAVGWFGYVIGFFGLAYSFYMFKGAYDIPKSIKKLEEIFDENGGFLWSDEAY